MANKRQLSILMKGVTSWNNWREKNPYAKIDLSEIIVGAADLSRAELRDANLSATDLNGADLRDANLSRADLRAAGLIYCNFNGAILADANFGGAEIWNTCFGNVDLSSVKGLDTIRHAGPSIIGIDTIYLSKGTIPEVFLRKAGVPENLITFMRSLTGKAFEFYSCFISYSKYDIGFSKRLDADLQAEGVRVWYFHEDAKWGEIVWAEIDRSIKVYDKLVVVCSEHSLQSGPVLREIGRALNREDKEGKNILFPITLDRFVFDNWEHPRKADVLTKVVGDFSGWDKDAAKYDKAFDKLLEGLQAQSTRV